MSAAKMRAKSIEDHFGLDIDAANRS